GRFAFVAFQAKEHAIHAVTVGSLRVQGSTLTISWDGPSNAMRRIFIHGLLKTSRQDEQVSGLRTLFACFGEVVEVSVPLQNQSSHTKGIAFVEFATSHSAVASLQHAKTKLQVHIR
ncbi:unnamed protein product, partial [Heterosigma akashiwo]